MLPVAQFLGEAQTAPVYRVYSIDDRHPGMFEAGAGGASVKGELYLVDDARNRSAAGGFYRLRVRFQSRRRGRSQTSFLGLSYSLSRS